MMLLSRQIVSFSTAKKANINTNTNTNIIAKAAKAAKAATVSFFALQNRLTLPSTRAFFVPPSRPTSTARTRTSAFHLFSTSSSDPTTTPSTTTTTTTTAAMTTTATTATANTEDDPYLWLEDVESKESLQFATEANEKCLASLGDPTSSKTNTYENVLSILESDDRIAYASNYGYYDDDSDVNGNGHGHAKNEKLQIMVNLWKDSKNPKGLWRKTTMASYKTSDPQWETILDIDALAEQDGVSWVWKGSSSLPRTRDPMSNGGRRVTRTLLSLSRGGADAVHTKEFDLLKEEFVSQEDGGFILPEAKTSASYKSRDVLFVGSDFGEGSLTDSGYPRVIKEWSRGSNIEDAPVVFEGDKSDVSVSAYINDQGFRGGPIYEVHSRSLTFYTSKRRTRRLKYEHLLSNDDPARKAVEDPEDFIDIDVQPDAGVTFAANMLLISLRSDWKPIPDGQTYSSGSLLYVDANTFLTEGKEACEYNLIFEPTNTTAYEDYTFTKNYFILSIMDNVKTKLTFYKIDDDGSSFKYVGGDKEAQILQIGAGAVDAYDGDKIWFYTSGYTEPSALSLGDASLVENDTVDDNGYILEKLKSLPDMYDSADLTVQQKFATSEDGTKVPYFIVSKKDITLDGSTPTLLYGYGGFEISLGPKYISTVGKAWLERGGVYVEGNIRGGGEYGPNWHQAALKEKRHKAYEDFIAIGEDLVASKICTPSTLAARGGSNGGLLMGMMYTLRPNLFGAIHCAVPLLDMKRFHMLLAGASWMAEYGDPSTSDWDNYLHKYSPYHLIDENNEKYPPMLVTTSTRDDRVHPGHARKMVKKVWDIALKNNKDWPLYYYENIEGGHGGAADAKQSAFMTALAYDFMWDTLSKDN
jgi:prolyl oligopeptidase